MSMAVRGSRHSKRHLLSWRTTWAAATAFILSGCAFLNRDNTPTLNWVRENMVPEEPGKRIAAMPVVYPIGLGAVATDAFIIHPATVIDDAVEDTDEICWSWIDWEEEYVTECAGLPWRTGATPVVFGGCFLGRSAFDIPDRAATQRERDKAGRSISRAKRLLDEGKPKEALRILDEISPYNLDDEDTEWEVESLTAKAALKCGRYERISSWFLRELIEKKPDRRGEIQSILDEMKQSDDYRARWKAVEIELEMAENPEREIEILRNRVLRDPSSAFRHRGLERIEGASGNRIRRALLPDLERIADEDSDLLNRSYAAKLIRDLEEGRSDRSLTPIRW